MNNIYVQLFDLLSESIPVALATVTSTTGSAPQRPGSTAIFDAKGLVSGTVGGGIVEGKILQNALDSISSGASGYYRFSLNKEKQNGEDSLCGGQIEILLDASPEDHKSVFEQLKLSLERRKPGVLASVVTPSVDNSVVIERFWFEEKNPARYNGKEFPETGEVLREGKYKERKILSAGKEQYVFLEPVYPPPHLIIAGAGHIGKALSHIGNLLDFEVTVVDDRAEYANPVNLPDADHIIVKDVGEAMEEIDLEKDTYVVIVTRGHKNDAKALRPCIGSNAAYIGMIGSRNKVSLMREEFIKKGWAEPREWKDIHAPIGIDIHSQTVQEIAVSIAAQLVQVRNEKVPEYA